MAGIRGKRTERCGSRADFKSRQRAAEDQTGRASAILALLSLAMMIVSLDQYIVVVALPDIARDLGYAPQTMQLVVSAYAIASSGCLLLGGRAADLLGHRRVLLVGLSLYLLASLGGGLARTIVQQLTARAIQGLGGALVFPSTLALINVSFREGAERNRALGVWAGAGAAGLVIGVLAGGALTSAFGWRAVFLVNVPLAAVAFTATLALIERDVAVDRLRAFDVPGAVTATGAVTLIVMALVRGPDLGWRSPATIGSLSAGLALGVIFSLIERRARDPLLPFRMLRNPSLTLGMVTAFLFTATFGALLYFISIYLQDVLGYSALRTGLVFLMPTLVVALSSSLAGRVVTPFGLHATMIAALLTGMCGAVALALAISPEASWLALVPGLTAISIGDGALFTAMFIAAATAVPDRQQGVASGIVSTASGIGAAVGLAVLVVVENAGIEGLAGSSVKTQVSEAIADVVYAIACGMMLTLFIVVGFRLRLRGHARR